MLYKTKSTIWPGLVEAITILVILLQPVVSVGQVNSMQGYPFIQHFPPSSYNAMPENWAITQSDEGLMYFGNIAGVMEYDGVSWRLIPLTNRSIARSMDKDLNGRIWVGGVGDFGYLEPDKNGFTQYHSIMDELPTEHHGFDDVWITTYFEGKIYYTTFKGLYIYDPIEREFEFDPTPMFLFKLEDQAFAHGRGTEIIYKVEKDTIVELFQGWTNAQVTNAQVRIFGVFKNHKGNTCFITHRHGIMEYDGVTLKSFTSEIDSVIQEQQFYTYAKTEFSNNLIAIGSFDDKGIYIFDRQGEILQHIDQTSGMSMSSFLFNDSNEMLWNAKIDGISKIELNTPYKIFDKRSGIVGRVRALYNYRGTIYAAGDPYVWVKKPESSNFEIVKGIPSSQYWDFIEFQGKLIVAGRSIFELSGNVSKQIIDFPNIGPPTNFHVSKQDSSILFLGLPQGNTGVRVVQYKNDQWIDKGSIPGIEEWAYDMNESPPGTLWVGTNATGAYKIEMPSYKGDFKLEDAKVTHYGQEQGLPNGEIKTPEINGKIYFSVMNDFIYRYNSETDRFLRDTIFDDAFNDNSAYQWAKLKEDKKGRVWIATGKGAALATPKGDGTYSIDKPPFAHFKADMIYDFGTGDGEEVWFINEEGLVQYDPSRIHHRNKETTTIIRNIEAGDSLKISGGSTGFKLPETTLDFSDNSIRFDFTITSYIDESQSEFQTFLEGFDKEWSTWNKNTWKEYEQLREGDYVFHVRGRNLYDQEGTQATFAFHINPPLYRSNLAYAFYILMAILFLELGRRILKKRVQHKEQQKFELREAQAKSEKLELESEKLKLESELLESEKNRMESELNIAKNIQMGMLSTNFPRTNNLEIHADLLPATEVGGDFYDFFFLDEDHFSIVVGDVSGKGVPAALMMAVCKTLIKSHAENSHSTAHILTKVNDEMAADNVNSMFVTVFMGIINIKKGELTCSNAGHNPTFIKHANNSVQKLVELHGPVVAAMEGIPYKESKIQLQSGDVIFAYTDGIPEAHNMKKEMYSDEELVNFITKYEFKSAKQLVDDIIFSVIQFEAEADRFDDITALCLKYDKMNSTIE